MGKISAKVCCEGLFVLMFFEMHLRYPFTRGPETAVQRFSVLWLDVCVKDLQGLKQPRAEADDLLQGPFFSTSFSAFEFFGFYAYPA